MYLTGNDFHLVHDHLAYTTSLPLPLHTLPDVLDGPTKVNQEDGEKIRNSMKVTETIIAGYREGAAKLIMKLRIKSSTHRTTLHGKKKSEKDPH